MKILLVSSLYAPHATGGAERVVRTLATEFRSGGHDVLVLTTAVGADEPLRLIDGVRVRALPLKNVHDLSPAPSHALLKPVWHAIDSYNPMMRANLAQVIREEAPDVVHTHLLTGFSASAWDAAHDAGVPVIHTLHDYYVICARSSLEVGGVVCTQQHWDCALLSRPRIRATRHVAAVVGVSQFVLARHLEFGAFTGTRSMVIPNPCHLVDDGPMALPHHGPLRIGFLGRLRQNKGIQLLLDSTSMLPSSGWTLRIAGTGEVDFVAALTSRHADDKISFVGSVNPRDFLSDLDVLVVPSLFPETFGMGTAEALAMGVPSIVSDRGALRELIQDGRNGFVFDPGTDGMLAERLRRVIEQPSIVRSMRAECVASAAPLAPPLIAARYESLYREVVESADRPRPSAVRSG